VLKLKVLSGSGDAKHLIPKQPFDREQNLDVFWTVATLATLRSDWLQIFNKFPFPIAKGMHFNAGDSAGRTNGYSAICALRSILHRHKKACDPSSTGLGPDTGFMIGF
jgi:hypothetical protein